MQALDVDYVLVIFGGYIGYSSDDINKFLWMVRIAGSTDPRIKEEDYYSKDKRFTIDASGSDTMLNCLMYKLCYYRFTDLYTQGGTIFTFTLALSHTHTHFFFRWICFFKFYFCLGKPPGFDRVREVEIGNKDVTLTHLEEAYTSEHWLVRIYKVLPPMNRG